MASRNAGTDQAPGAADVVWTDQTAEEGLGAPGPDAKKYRPSNDESMRLTYTMDATNPLMRSDDKMLVQEQVEVSGPDDDDNVI